MLGFFYEPPNCFIKKTSKKVKKVLVPSRGMSSLDALKHTYCIAFFEVECNGTFFCE